MFRNLAANLINHERIVTTDAKAKELRRVTDRLITKAKRLGAVAHTTQDKLDDDGKAKRLHVSRQLAAFLPRWGIDRDGETKRDLVEKVLVELSQRFAGRAGGYTRITKLGPRKGDGAKMAVIEFVDAPEVEGNEMPAAAASVAAAEPEGGGAAVAADDKADEGASVEGEEASAEAAEESDSSKDA